MALPAVKASAAPWSGVIDFLAERLPAVSRADWNGRLARGEVLDERGRAIAPDAAYQGGTRLYYYRALPFEPPIPFEAAVLFQDETLVVADKPHFLPVTPGGRYVQQSLLVRLQRQLGLQTLSPIHRIDRETAGLVLFSVRPQDRAAYQAMFRERVVDKVYEAIAPWREAPVFPVTRRSRIEEDGSAFFRMQEVDGAANSETRIECIEQRGPLARYRLTPVTGKRHQLRVHMNALGLPIAGDQFYPQVLRGPDAAEDFSNPLRLLAQAIAFTDPVTGQPRQFQSQRALDWPI